MLRENIILRGNMLVAELRQRAAEFNGKSSQHDELSWQAIDIEARVNMLLNGDYTSLREKAKTFNSWDVGLSEHSPEQGEKVLDFYRVLYAHVAT